MSLLATSPSMDDPIRNQIRFDIPIPSPCCGRGMLAWGLFYGSKVYVCRNCLNFVERKDAIPLIRAARRHFKDDYRNLMVRIVETETFPENAGVTLKIPKAN